jgi:hypothetical protein
MRRGRKLEITALADVFPDRVAFARQLLNDQRGQQIPESRCFTGFDSHQKLLDSAVDLVLHARVWKNQVTSSMEAGTADVDELL